MHGDGLEFTEDTVSETDYRHCDETGEVLEGGFGGFGEEGFCAPP